MLARLGYQSIQVLERLPAPPTPDSSEWGNPDRSYGLGINGRGQKTLKELGCWERIEARTADVNGSLEVKPNGECSIRLSSQKKYVTKIIQRDRLVACLLEDIHEKYSGQVTVLHNTECTAAQWDAEGRSSSGIAPLARLTCVTQSSEGGEEEVYEVETEFLVGADGFRSTIPTAMESAPGSSFKRVVFEDTNPRVYKTLKFFAAPEWRFDMNLSSSSADKEVGVNLQGLPIKEGYMAGLLLFKPGNQAVEGLSAAEDAREFLAAQFPAILPYVPEEEFEKLAQRPVNRLPVFQYCTPSLHHGSNTVLLGDCIHTVKPYFGMGVNSAFEDVAVLQRSLRASEHRLEAALPAFSRSHKGDAHSLVRMSRRFDTGGFVGFVLPIILDGVFSKAAPWLFGPNNIRLMQNNDLRFSEIARKKLLDRILQVSIIGGLIAVVCKLAHMLFGSASRYLASFGTAV
mmetsp:Transcript_37247/g.105094  ORF Transcript_37247/g.105094 Transcript_37247/m.105094 type:complete len:458 (+) Transcript_37247:47-1420(+)